MDESENYVELICLINASEMPLSASINRMYLQLASLVRDIVSVLEGDDLDLIFLFLKVLVKVCLR